MSNTEPTMLWHDYETFGVSPQKDLPCQFAAVRTDTDLNPVGKPINIMNQIANDYLPQPEACLVTGITPQLTLRDGMIEAEFARQIHEAMSLPNTCVAGYNSIRFDDEVSRYLFYRNFYDPYGREWRNGNSRWDIIDLVRACYALRPEGIEWPLREDGSPTFKLEELSKANNLDHGRAHDALSDVYATIALAKLIKTCQPKLYDYMYSLRSKHNVLDKFDLSKPSVLLHISSRLPAAQGCCTWVMPVAMHPHNPNAVIVIDLAKSPDVLVNEPVEEIRERLYSSQEDLGDVSRPGLKLIHINRSPFITTAKAMTPENAQRLGMDRETCLANFKVLAAVPDIVDKAVAVYQQENDNTQYDADHALYSGGFINNEDRRWCDDVLQSAPEMLDTLGERTQNIQLRTMLFRYRARNYPQTLTVDETRRWQAHRKARLTDNTSPASVTLETYLLTIEQLAQRYNGDVKKQGILRALYQYAENL
ncbi:exodeoxyribonuclease I [Alteromonas pelagimontana]|uniref:Exodeoxyribonuclease I n=1 Tax=Alteromonas pelagimontana TaxID=1858656 RepID=A0A6M4M8C8_9ALTE|nr:exodeoxyribonuclease I [Alteromonas pelagimontana]QJR79481.1 exodeoxyribonuclease I [Alteromonas pelagimontana]